MTQQEINRVVVSISEATTQLRIAMDRLDMQERIITAQDEMIQLLQHSLTGREKFITVLENQLSIQDNVINKAKQIIKG